MKQLFIILALCMSFVIAGPWWEPIHVMDDIVNNELRTFIIDEVYWTDTCLVLTAARKVYYLCLAIVERENPPPDPPRKYIPVMHCDREIVNI